MTINSAFTSSSATNDGSAIQDARAQDAIARIREKLSTAKPFLWTPIMTLNETEIVEGIGEDGLIAPCSDAAVQVRSFCLANGIKMVIWKDCGENFDCADNKQISPPHLYSVNIAVY